MLLPGLTGARAQAIAQAIVAGCGSLQGEGGEALSVSIGLARIEPSDVTLGACMQRADRALYRAKAEGRGRSRSAEEDAADCRADWSLPTV